MGRVLAFLIVLLTAGVGVDPALADTKSLKTVVNPEHLMDTTQYGFSQAMIVSSEARVLYVSGQMGISEEGPNDFESQVDRSFDNLFAIIKAAGGGIEDIVKITLLIKDHDQKRLQYLGEKRLILFGANPPASTLIPVLSLALDAMDFEIDAIVVLPNE